MLRTPTEFELQSLLHYAVGYDPIAAKENYEKHKKLKGRRRGASKPPAAGRRPSGQDPRTGKPIEQIHQDAKAKQKKELAVRIKSLDDKLKRLEAKIRELRHEDAADDRKSKAKKERAAKERDKPKTAA